MSRPSRSPSGPSKSVSISLAPEEIERLDAMVAEAGVSRSVLVSRWLMGMELFARVDAMVSMPVRKKGANVVSGSSNASTAARDCDHRRQTVIGGGLRKCIECEAVRGMDRVWRGS